MFDFAAARHHMVESQIRTSDVTDLNVLKAFRTIARDNFVPQAQMALAYSDANISLGNGRHILRPRDHAKLVQAAEVLPTDIVLDIGCGRGYSTAILAALADTVIGLENSEDEVERATQILSDRDVLNAAIVAGDLKGGASEHGPFNVIFINGALSCVPKTWFDQLANGGRLVCIMEDGPIGRATVFTRAGDAIGERVIFDANVPSLPGFAREPEFVF